MKTQRLNLLEAINFAMAGHEVRPYDTERTLRMHHEDGALRVTETPRLDHPKKTVRLFNHLDFETLKDVEWHVGDDRTIKGYY